MTGFSRLRRVAATTWVALYVALTSGVTLGPAAADQTKINVAFGLVADFLPAFVAKEDGLFAANGLEVTLTAFPNTSVIAPMLFANTAQIGASTLPNLVLGGEAGLDLVAIGGAARLTKANAKSRLLTRPGVSVASAADLVGKKVGVPGVNSVLDIYFRKWLRDKGVASGAVTIIEAPFAVMGDMLKGGQLDVVVAIQPLLGRIVAGGAVPSIDYLSETDPDIVGSVWAATRPFADANPATVAAFRKSVAQGLAAIGKDPERAREVEKKYLGFNGPAFPSFSTDLAVADFDSMIRICQELGLKTSGVVATKLIWSGGNAN